MRRAGEEITRSSFRPAAADGTTPAGQRFEAFLDAAELGFGPCRVTRLGDGASNLTYRLERGTERMVVRRPPPPPLPPSAHDVIREARLQLALGEQGVRVPEVLAVCDDPTVIGVPFYVMEEIDGYVVTDAEPPSLRTPSERRRVGFDVIEALAELHAVDWRAGSLRDFGRADGYLERQLRRWTSLHSDGDSPPIPGFDALTERLRSDVPVTAETTVVHGDYRLGNLMVGASGRSEIVAVLDWEMATLGDPLADLGYLIATWSDPEAELHPMLLSPVTTTSGWPTREELVARYVVLTGRDASRLDWYQALALWKSAVFCRAIHARFERGERNDPWAGSLGDGLARLVEVASAWLH